MESFFIARERAMHAERDAGLPVLSVHAGAVSKTN